MSVPTVETPNNTTDTATNRRRVTWRDLILLGWQQHRMLVTGTGIIAFIGAGLMTLLSIVLAKGGIDIPIPVFSSLRQPAQLLERCIAGYGAVVAVFWAAPLLAREYEQRTHLFAWAQDVSALRWLVAKTLLLATVATGFAALLGSLGTLLLREFNAAATTPMHLRLAVFDGRLFEAAPLVQMGYALFGFALGLVLSALCRRTVLAMGLTLVTFTVVRGLVAGVFRPYYQTPVRAISPLDERSGGLSVPEKALYVDSGYLGATGEPIQAPEACYSNTIPNLDERLTCLREHDITTRYTDYQPVERLDEFHLVEFGLFTAGAVLLFGLTWRLMRRHTRL